MPSRAAGAQSLPWDPEGRGKVARSTPSPDSQGDHRRVPVPGRGTLGDSADPGDCVDPRTGMLRDGAGPGDRDAWGRCRSRRPCGSQDGDARGLLRVRGMVWVPGTAPVPGRGCSGPVRVLGTAPVPGSGMPGDRAGPRYGDARGRDPTHRAGRG